MFKLDNTCIGKTDPTLDNDINSSFDLSSVKYLFLNSNLVFRSTGGRGKQSI